MDNYKELIKQLDGACLFKMADDMPKAELFSQAADAIEQLVEERDKAIDDMKQYGANICAYCKKRIEQNCCVPHEIRPSTCGMFEWRGMQKTSDAIVVTELPKISNLDKALGRYERNQNSDCGC